MSVQAAKLMVSVCGRDVCVRIAGRANFTSGPDFKILTTELQQQGYRHFVIDATECALMDSTFLGLLCGLGLKLREFANGQNGVELLNPNSRVSELLESLGATAVIRLVTGSCKMTDGAILACEIHTREEVAQTSLEAHETLMALNPENAARFKDVTQFLAEDLKKMKAASASLQAAEL
jgi:anti-anti-sigma regulatory factor